MRRVSFIGVVGAISIIIPILAFAETSDELRQAIAEHAAQITQLNKEITQYESQLADVSAKKKTLQNTIIELNLLRKKLAASINVTKNEIGTTQLEIRQLEEGIASRQQAIATNEAGLGESIRHLNETEERPLAAQMLSSDSLSDIWQDADDTVTLQNAVKARIELLAAEKKQLTDAKAKREKKNKNLEEQKSKLVTQQGSLDATRKTQNDLLAETKSQESTYQKILAEKKKQEASFESALSDLQSRLQKAVDLSHVTPAGTGVLHSPLENFRVTQYFGNTPFAASGAYAGKGHNGIDLAAQIGTPIKAALTGVVLSTGNTDSTRGCYSFGKWIMIKHSNGLNTMYAHLSQIAVSPGQTVATGDIIGYSGETGYATGPHLHFGVYVGSATQIMRLGDATKSSTACAGASMPISPLSAYLNPLNYL